MPAKRTARNRSPRRRKPHAAGWVALLGLAGIVATLVGCATTQVRPAPGTRLSEPVMEVTGYCNCGECCSWHRTWLGQPVFSSGSQQGKPKPIGVTASGMRARTGTIAADIRRYPLGTVMYVPGYGYGRVEDTGSKIVGDRLDLWFSSHRRALDWGRRKLVVKVWLPPSAARIPDKPAPAATTTTPATPAVPATKPKGAR